MLLVFIVASRSRVKDLRSGEICELHESTSKFSYFTESWKQWWWSLHSAVNSIHKENDADSVTYSYILITVLGLVSNNNFVWDNMQNYDDVHEEDFR